MGTYSGLMTIRVRVLRPIVGALVVVTLVTWVGAVGAGGASAVSTAQRQGVEPSFGAALNSRMGTLFHDISIDSLPQAEKIFFPESAYVAMKVGRIASPGADYVDRLIGFLRLDLAAYHATLFARATSTFLGVNVNPGDAAWIRPGWCENSIGYWHVPGVRLVYRQKNVVRSVAVASLISWQGVWYVVHLGPNPRPRNVGTVDAPALGRGVPGPAGGC